VPLTAYHYLDLDTDAPDWGVVDDEYADGIDIGLTGLPSLSGKNTAEMAVMPELPTFDECRQATGLTDDLSDEQTAPDTHLCVRTTEGSYAYVGIVAVVGDPTSVTLDITVWE
jgi:hypothetical protein